jgi:putative nucleotidyltransferase with HDIG domain
VTTRLRHRISVEGARRLAESLLEPLGESRTDASGNRWQHTIGVAARAAELADAVAVADREVLVAAAWLHDIGYARSVRDTGFHPLDGARFLDRERWPPRISALVAHHSGARFVAQANGHAEALSQFIFERSPVSDALTYADQTVGPRGQPVPLEERLADMLRRHGPDSAQARVHHHREPYLRAAALRVVSRFWRTGR